MCLKASILDMSDTHQCKNCQSVICLSIVVSQQVTIKYIPRKKIGQIFLPPWNGFFAINYHHWTSGNAFWPFLDPTDPWGCLGKVRGSTGVRGTKNYNFFWEPH